MGEHAGKPESMAFETRDLGGETGEGGVAVEDREGRDGDAEFGQTHWAEIVGKRVAIATAVVVIIIGGGVVGHDGSHGTGKERTVVETKHVGGLVDEGGEKLGKPGRVEP